MTRISNARTPSLAAILLIAILLPSWGFAEDPVCSVESRGCAEEVSIGTTLPPLLSRPPDGLWLEAGSMNVPRMAHRFVATSAGIMAIGGSSGDSASAEIYDPDADTWTPVARMNRGREYFHVTRLNDGRILVAGGSSGFDAEIYDPSNDVWTLTSPLPGGRDAGSQNTNSMVTLNDGRALLAGGRGQSVVLPQSTVVTSAGSFSAHLISNAATNGLGGILVNCGGGLSGDFPPEVSGNIALVQADGVTNFRAKTVEAMASGASAIIWFYPSDVYGADYLFTPSQFGPFGEDNNGIPWIPALSVSYNTGTILLQLAGEQVTIIAAATQLMPAGQTTLLYNPASDTWRFGAPMNAVREDHTLTVLPDGRVLAVGGSTGGDLVSGLLDSAEIYDPVADSWSLIDPMPAVADPPAEYCGATSARSVHSANLLPTGKVLVCGGWGAIWDGYDFSCGSYQGSSRSSCLLLDLDSMSWSETDSMESFGELQNRLLGRAGHASFSLSGDAMPPPFDGYPAGSVVVVGGADNDTFLNTRATQIFNPTTETWTRLPDMAPIRPLEECEPSYYRPRVIPLESAIGKADVRILGAIDGNNNIVIGGVGGLGRYALRPCNVSLDYYGGSDQIFRYVADRDYDSIPDSRDMCSSECPSRCLDLDRDGCSDQTLAGLISLVEETPIGSSNVKNGLLAKLSEAQKALGRDNIIVAAHKLEDFRDQLAAQAGNTISTQDAALLDSYASDLLAKLDSGEPI